MSRLKLLLAEGVAVKLLHFITDLHMFFVNSRINLKSEIKQKQTCYTVMLYMCVCVCTYMCIYIYSLFSNLYISCDLLNNLCFSGLSQVKQVTNGHKPKNLDTPDLNRRKFPMLHIHSYSWDKNFGPYFFSLCKKMKTFALKM